MYVLIAEPIDTRAVDWLEAQGADVIRGYDGEPWEGLADRIEGFIYRGQLVLDGEFMDGLPALRVIGKHGVGVNTVDLKAAAQREILVTNTPGANANSVAEHAVSLLLAVTRTIVSCDSMVRAGRYRERLGLSLVRELRETRLGVVGGGRIGTRVAEIMRGGFSCEIGIYDPYVDADAVAHLQPRMFTDVGSLCEWADNVEVAAPLTEETAGLIGTAELARLGPQGVIVISSRGGIVVETELADALGEGVIGGAGVDVYDPEPPSDDNPLLTLPNVVLTPHFGGHSDRARWEMAIRVCEQVWSLLNGGEAPVVGGESWL